MSCPNTSYVKMLAPQLKRYETLKRRQYWVRQASYGNVTLLCRLHPAPLIVTHVNRFLSPTERQRLILEQSPSVQVFALICSFC